MLNKQVLRIEKPLGYMLNEQVLRVKKPTNHALKNASSRVEKPTNQALKTQVHELKNRQTRHYRTQVYELKNRQTRHYRTQVYELNTAFLLTTFTPSTTQTATKPLPLIRKHVSRQAHPLLRRAVVNRLLSPRFLSHPLLSEGLGEAFFVNFFPPHFPIYALSPSKRRPFAS